MINISSAQNKIFREVVLLIEKKRQREKTQRFVVEGDREIERAKLCGFQLLYTFGLKGDYVLTADLLKKISVREGDAGKIGVFEQKNNLQETLKEKFLGQKGPWIALFDVEKPQNLGAAARSASCFGFEGIITVGESVDGFSPHAIRASVGAIFACPPLHMTREIFWSLMKTSQATTIAAAFTAKSLPLCQATWKNAAVFMFGNEAKGLSTEDLASADLITHIPAASVVVDSLNLSNAAAVYMYEHFRRKKVP